MTSKRLLISRIFFIKYISKRFLLKIFKQLCFPFLTIFKFSCHILLFACFVFPETVTALSLNFFISSSAWDIRELSCRHCGTLLMFNVTSNKLSWFVKIAEDAIFYLFVIVFYEQKINSLLESQSDSQIYKQLIWEPIRFTDLQTAYWRTNQIHIFTNILLESQSDSQVYNRPQWRLVL